MGPKSEKEPISQQFENASFPEAEEISAPEISKDNPLVDIISPEKVLAELLPYEQVVPRQKLEGGWDD